MKPLLSFVLILVATAVVAQQRYTDRSVKPWSLGWVETDSICSADYDDKGGKNHGNYVTTQNTWSSIYVDGGVSNTATALWQYNYNIKTYPSKDRSLSFWMKAGPELSPSYLNGGEIWTYNLFWVGFNDRTDQLVYFQPYQGSAWVYYCGAATQGTWIHWAFTHNGTTGACVAYRNGIVTKVDTAASATNTPTSGQTKTGAINGTTLTPEECNASVYDDVYAVARVLTSNEVVQIYNYGRNRK